MTTATLTLETIAALVAAGGLVLVALRKAIIDLVRCLQDIRDATNTAKREATRAKNISATGADRTVSEVHRLGESVEALTQDVRQLTRVLNHRTIHVDQEMRDLDERLKQCENHPEQ